MKVAHKIVLNLMGATFRMHHCDEGCHLSFSWL
jgi:hypothetical protein